MSKDTLIQELSKWQHVIDSQIERRGEAALLRRTTEALLHAMDDAKGYKTNWDVCELKRKAEENQREISGDFDFTKAQAFNLKVLGLTVAEISIMKNWFESKSGKNITDFWEEAFNAGIRTSQHLSEPKREISGVPIPSEAMCDNARGFVMGLDLNIRTWGAMKKHLSMGGYLCCPRINTQAEVDPKGHITKWDVAECIYILMNTKTEIEDGSAR